ncbi:MAG: glycosyltransferase family 2 protein [Candidatus Melainabacteria bacterium]
MPANPKPFTPPAPPVFRHPPETGLVSVVMAVYQAEATVQAAIDSILSQTYPKLEVLLVDDGSTDGSAAILAGYSDPRVRVIRQTNAGVARARNHGLQEARGEWIAFLDSDDLWLPHKVARELAVIAEQPNPVGLVYSGYYAIDEADRLVNAPAVPVYSGHIRREVLLREGMLLPSTTLMHRDVIAAVGGFPVNSYHEDRVFFVRISQQFPIWPTAQRLVLYRQSEAGRCRRILSDYETALEAENSISTALAPYLTPDEQTLVKAQQDRSLLFRFLMYDQMKYARRMHRHVAFGWPQARAGGLKDKLAWLSLVTGINWLSATRRVYQFFSRRIMGPRLLEGILTPPGNTTGQ